MTLSAFVQNILTLTTLFKGSVTSWFRSKERNKQVGGHSRSLHLCGLAVDIVLDDDTLKHEFFKMCVRLGLRVVDEGDHYHVQIP